MRYETNKKGKSVHDRIDICKDVDKHIEQVMTDMIYDDGIKYKLRVYKDGVYLIFLSRRLATHLRHEFPDKFTNEPRKVWTNNLNWINNLLYSRTGAHYWLNWNNPKRTRTRMNGLMLRNIFESSYCQCWFMNTGWIQKPTVCCKLSIYCFQRKRGST